MSTRLKATNKLRALASTLKNLLSVAMKPRSMKMHIPMLRSLILVMMLPKE
jgi:hypothetical protein